MRPGRTRRGAVIAETTASLLFVIPLLIIICFAAFEAFQAYLIYSTLTQAANQAARELSRIYPSNSAITHSRALQDVLVFDNIRQAGILHDSAQFENPVFDETAINPTVTVIVNYTGGRYGLPPFPNPDPLNLGSQFQISGTSTYRLE